MKAIFFCGHKSPYGLAHLEPLLNSKFKIIAIVIATDERWNIFREKLLGKNYYSTSKVWIKKIKKILYLFLPLHLKKKDYIKVKEIAKKNNVPVWVENDINSEKFIQKIKDQSIDLIFCAAYPQVFSKELLLLPSKGAVNFHPSLLPKFRGAHPHYWTIVKGEVESGITAHFMTEEIDAGDIIAQVKFPIKDYNYAQLYNKIISETPNIVKRVEDFFLKGCGMIVKNNIKEGSYFRNDREIHHRIFWDIHTAQEIFNLVRGGNAFCFFRNKKIIIEDCFITETNRNLTNDVKVKNGIIVDFNKHAIAVKAISGIVNITYLRYLNRRMHFSEFIIKYKPLIGEFFD